MIDFLTDFDGSGREPWEHQKKVLRWLSDNWNGYSVFGLNLPTGSGKSALARSIQKVTGAAYLSPNNLLVDQFASLYPGVNVVKGKSHYTCHENPDLTCEDRSLLPGHNHCRECRYRMAKARAVQGEHTLFNPLSYWFILPQPGFKPPNVLIIDEAHRLEGMLMDLGSAELSITRYGSPLSPNLVDVCAWLKENAFKLEKEVALLLRANDVDRALHASTQALRVRTILQCIEAEPQCFHIYRETRELKRKKETYTVIKPLSVPLRILRQFFNCQKLVLMSATLPRPDVESLSLGRAIAYLDMPNPIPAVQRPILYRPAAVAMNFKTETKDMVEWIRGHLQPGVNTIVHVTYAWASKLKMYFPEALTHTPETKNKVLDKFKRSRGALWLAAGCAEGVDLPGDECRLNLIPMLYRQNISDPWVKKRMTIEGGNFWYNLEVLKATIQQTGRSTRGLTDKSTAIIGDPRFPRLIQELKEHVPVSFLDAIDWRTRSDDPGFDEGEDCLLSPVRKI